MPKMKAVPKRRYRFESDVFNFRINPVRLLLTPVLDHETKVMGLDVSISMLGDIVPLGRTEEDVRTLVTAYSMMRLTVAVRYETHPKGHFEQVYQLFGRTRRGWSNEPFIEITKHIDLPRVRVR